LIGTIGIAFPMRTFPEGLIVFPLPIAATTSSGLMLYDRSLSGSTLITIVRGLPPNGGGADTPGSDAKRGVTIKSAASCKS
jgi:hypothetical protein